MQDFDCAQTVVRSYLSEDKKEAAASFVAQCSGLKYKSDINKLKALI